MSDTPETDALGTFTVFDHAGQPYQSDLVPGDFARRLERERDEARRVSEDWERWIKEVLTDFRIPHDAHTEGMRIALTYWMVDMNLLSCDGNGCSQPDCVWCTDVVERIQNRKEVLDKDAE